MSFSNLKVELPNSPDSTTHDLRNLQDDRIDREAYFDEFDNLFPDLQKKVEIKDVNVLDADLPDTSENKNDDPKPILDINSESMQSSQQPTFQVGKNNPKFCDGLFDKTVSNPQPKLGHALVGPGQAQASSTYTAGPTNGNPQVQAGHAHVGPGHAQASSTHTGPVNAGPTNWNPQAQASHAHVGPSHAQASSTHAGPVYAGPTNWNPQAQAGHVGPIHSQASSNHTGSVYAGPTNMNFGFHHFTQAQVGHVQASSTHTAQIYAGQNYGNSQAQAGHAHVGPGHSQASSNHTGPVYAGPTNMNLGFHHYNNLQQHAHALEHPVYAQQGVQVPNLVQSNGNWNHSIQNGQIHGHAPQYYASHASAYPAHAQQGVRFPEQVQSNRNWNHTIQNGQIHGHTPQYHAHHNYATSNHVFAHHPQQHPQSVVHLGNAFGQDIESNLGQNQNVPIQCRPIKLHENPPIAQNNGVKKSGRKDRYKYNTAQVCKLEEKFKSQKYLSPEEREVLARELQKLARENRVITEVEVKNWFKNRRSKNGKTPKKVQILEIED